MSTIMMWCGAGRLSDRALRLPVDLFKANTLKRVTVTLQRGQAFPWSRSLRVCGGADGSTPPHRPDPHPVLNWDAGFVTTDWAHLDRVSTVAAGLSRAVQRDRTRTSPLHAERWYSIKGEPVCSVLFTGNWGVSGRRRSTSTMHSRASSTAAAAKRRSDAGGEHGNNKEDEREAKEASATSLLTEKAPEEPEPEGGKPNKSQQLKKVFKEYGAVGVCFHIGISLMSLGMFYLLISSGIDMAAMLCKLGFSETVVRSKMAAGTSTFVLAYAIHKLFAPVRISITLVSVPLIVRHFRKTGLFKPPTPAP